MRIALTTPTGNVGRFLVPALVRAGVRPLVLARDPGRLPADIRGAVDSAVVDQFDVESVVAATAGVDALFWVDPPGSSGDPVADYARAGDAVANAVERNAIGHVVFQSSIGAEKREGAGEIDGLAATELALDATGADITHLRCAFFFTNLLMQLDDIRTGTLPVTWPLDLSMPWVAPRDIAEVAALRLLAPRRSGRQVQGVQGPVDLTWTQAGQIIADATGRPLRVEQIADDDMRHRLRTAGLGDRAVETTLGMSVGLRDDFVAEQQRSLETTTPTTLAAWAYDELRPLL